MSVNDTPLVSVVMANYNGAAHIAAAVRSVLSQTLQPLELIVSDDASSDDSLAIAETEANGDPRLILLKSETRRGPARVRNLGIDAARGQWIAVVDNDDFIEPNRLEQLVAAAHADGADIVADDMCTFYEDGSRAPHRHLRPPFSEAAHWIDAPTYALSNLLLRGGGHLGYLKPLVRSTALGDMRYDETLRIGEDSDLVLRLLIAGARMRLYPQVGYHYRKHSASTSHRLRAIDVDAMLAANARLDAGDDKRLAMALARQRDALLDARAFTDLVTAIKQRRLAQSVSLVAQRPTTMWLLREPIVARLGLQR